MSKVAGGNIHLPRSGDNHSAADDIAAKGQMTIGTKMSNTRNHVIFICGDILNTGARARIDKNGGVLIPANFRKTLGIHAGDEIVVRIKDGELRITTLKRRLERAQQRVRKYVKPGGLLVDDLLAERREGAKRG